MKKIFLFLLLFALALPAHSEQADTSSQVNSNSWAIKGKVLPWIVLGSGINYTLGVEYGFNKVNSIGIDFVYNDNSAEHDVYDTVKKSEVSGPRMYTVSRGLFINYRRYLDISNTSIYRFVSKRLKTDYLPYVGAFARYGKTDYHYQSGYITSQISYDEWQYSGGVLLGIVCGPVDINAGPFYKQKYITDVENENASQVFHSHMQPTFGFRVGVNLFLIVKKNSGHYLAKYATANY